MKIIDGKALLMRLRNPKKVTEVIPKSREVKDNNVLVHWGVGEAQTLQGMDIKAPSPIEGQYTWTGKIHAVCTPEKDCRLLDLTQTRLLL